MKSFSREIGEVFDKPLLGRDGLWLLLRRPGGGGKGDVVGGRDDAVLTVLVLGNGRKLQIGVRIVRIKLGVYLISSGNAPGLGQGLSSRGFLDTGPEAIV